VSGTSILASSEKEMIHSFTLSASEGLDLTSPKRLKMVLFNSRRGAPDIEPETSRSRYTGKLVDI
jgi:hypothetical protein